MSNIKLSNHNWHVRGVYDPALGKTQEAINADEFGGTTIASTPIATFSAPGAFPVKDMLVNIAPVQAGSGDPSPSNVRAISGWAGCKLVKRNANLLVGRDYVNNKSISSSGSIINQTGWRYTSAYSEIKGGVTYLYQANVSTVQGGMHVAFYGKNKNFLERPVVVSALDIVSGLNYGIVTAPADAAYCRANMPSSAREIMLSVASSPQAYDNINNIPLINIDFSSEASTVYAGTLNPITGELKARPYYASYNGETLTGPWISSMDVYAEGTTPTTGAQVVDLGGAETVYQLTPVEIKTLLGQNNIWADCGDVSVTYGAYLETVQEHADKVGDSILSAIAPLEHGTTASQAYAQGAYFFRSGVFCKAKTAIASGVTFTLNTNYEVTTVAAELFAALNP